MEEITAWFEAFSWWKLIYWAISLFGIGGTIALLAIYPIAFKAVATVVIRCFSFVLSYRIGCALLAAIMAGLVADYWRHSADDADFAERTAAYNQEQVERDARIAKETRDLVWREIADATAQNTVIDNEVKEFHDALPSVPSTGNIFRIGTDACRLRHIAGQTECGPDGSKPVPKANPGNEGGRHRRSVGLSSGVSRSLGKHQ